VEATVKATIRHSYCPLDCPEYQAITQTIRDKQNEIIELQNQAVEHMQKPHNGVTDDMVDAFAKSFWGAAASNGNRAALRAAIHAAITEIEEGSVNGRS
jgi:hypothetical protein